MIVFNKKISQRHEMLRKVIIRLNSRGYFMEIISILLVYIFYCHALITINSVEGMVDTYDRVQISNRASN